MAAQRGDRYVADRTITIRALVAAPAELLDARHDRVKALRGSIGAEIPAVASRRSGDATCVDRSNAYLTTERGPHAAEVKALCQRVLGSA
jgi:hypothetical protein